METEGLDVTPGQVSVDVNVNGTVMRRIYDFAIRKGDGKLTGVEVKGGTASRTARQRTIDDAVQNGAEGTTRGSAAGAQVDDVMVIWVPRS